MSEAEPPAPKRTIAYIDGFNLYFGMLKSNPSLKWLDIQSLMDTLRPHEDVTHIRYFTAIVDSENPTASSRRQMSYMTALGFSERVRAFYGKYQERTVTCRGTCREVYQTPEEKKTDVKIAVQMMSDAIGGMMDRIILVSGDSDLEPAIEWIVQRYKEMKVTVYIPKTESDKNQRRNDNYKSMGVEVQPMPIEELFSKQLSSPIKLKSGRLLHRPSEWA